MTSSHRGMEDHLRASYIARGKTRSYKLVNGEACIRLGVSPGLVGLGGDTAPYSPERSILRRFLVFMLVHMIVPLFRMQCIQSIRLEYKTK